MRCVSFSLFIRGGIFCNPMMIKLEVKIDIINDSEVLKIIYNKYFKSLVLYSLSYTHRRDTSEDIVQDVIVNFFERRRIADVKEDLHAYLRGAVIKASIKYCRDNNKFYFEELENEGAEETIAMFDDQVDTSIANLLVSVEHLPPRSRDVLKKIIFENKKHSEVAKELSISVTSVRTLYYNSLAKLRSSIKEIYFIFL